MQKPLTETGVQEPLPEPVEEADSESEATPEAGPSFEPAPVESPETDQAALADSQSAAEAAEAPAAAAPPEPPVEEATAPVVRSVPTAPEEQGETYGPVQNGETLWEIANEWGRRHGYGTNQVMLAIQQQNPKAFARNNINLLKRGAILRMPTRSQVSAWSTRQAMREALRQEDLFLNRAVVPQEPSELPAVAAVGPAAEPEPATEPAPEPESVGRLELVPPTGPEETPEESLGQGNSDDSSGTSGESVVEELARTQEELANAQQENTYLNERIRELEDELARRAAAIEVEDTGMAEMEGRLREERLDADRAEPADAVILPAEEAPWYSRLRWWLAGLPVLLVAALVWWLRSRPSGETPAAEIVDAEPAATPGDGQAQEPGDSDKIVELGRFKDPPARAHARARPEPDAEAVELDSEDPETKLDLARAYLSMGNVEAARAILEDVAETGNAEQSAEARNMLEEL